MIEESDFETFLYISKNQYSIFVDDKKNSKNLYKQELKIDDKINLEGLIYLSKYNEMKNIYTLEIENVSKDIIENKKESIFPGTNKKEIFCNAKLINNWINE